MNTQSFREGAALFDMSDRGLIIVSGEDRVRWLNGMVTNDVASLEEADDGAGCYAALLTPQGRVVSDLRIFKRGDAFWLETATSHVALVIERLAKYIIADDVELRDASADFARLAVEGARTRAVLEEAAGVAVRAEPDSLVAVAIAGVEVLLAGFGFSGEDAVQLLAPAEQLAAVRDALVAAGAESAGRETLDVMRIEAGVQALGSELGEDMLPDEARIGRAISETKGCYTGQEVIARLRARAGVKHLLVGLRSPSGQPLADLGVRIFRPDEKKSGELTSKTMSELAGGEVGLGFVHRDDAEPGTTLVCDGREVVVSALPFVEPFSRGDTVA